MTTDEARELADLARNLHPKSGKNNDLIGLLQLAIRQYPYDEAKRAICGHAMDHSFIEIPAILRRIDGGPEAKREADRRKRRRESFAQREAAAALWNRVEGVLDGLTDERLAALVDGALAWSSEHQPEAKAFLARCDPRRHAALRVLLANYLEAQQQGVTP